MDSFSSLVQDQLKFNKNMELQLEKLSTALPVATNPEQVYNITTRGGKSTRNPPFPKGTGRTPVAPANIPAEENRNQDIGEALP